MPPPMGSAADVVQEATAIPFTAETSLRITVAEGNPPSVTESSFFK